ncbi:MAG: chemotaxis response regulator protein-glutamate methylesterase [Kordiimonadales bacterium]|nr:MAG: chemotaxis response regulator protein-glutamate methylesterase [Kordiimonadales bacterium]
MSAKKIKVLIVDDSALIRQILTAVFDSDPEMELVGTAEDPLVARKMIKKLNPDVITLDIEMPKMDGLSFLEKLMQLRPMPVVMISSLTQRGTAQTLRALELGVCDIIGKPTVDLENNFDAMKSEILTKVKAAAGACVRPPEFLIRKAAGRPKPKPEANLIVIGASTGGVVALKEIIPLLPLGVPPIVIVQHMPMAYTAGLADRLDLVSRVSVRESSHGAVLEKNTAYIAHGGHHLRIGRKGNKSMILLHGDEEPMSGHKPSVDALFMSVAELGVTNVISIMLTGMGRDGADGMLALRQAGAFTLGQSEGSCVVYGMPRVAQQIGAVEIEMPLSKMAGAIESKCWPSGENRRFSSTS